MTKKNLPKFAYADRVYVRFIRRARGQSIMLKEMVGSPEFWDHYNRLLQAPKPAHGAVALTGRNFEALIKNYYESDSFRRKKPRTKQDYRKYMEHIRKIWGHLDPQKVETHHIFKLRNENAKAWRQANYLVQCMVILMNHARLIGFLKKEHGNPAKGVPLYKQESDGWEPWPDDVRAEFEAVAGPRARLVYELCLGLGQRIGDVLKIRWNHIEDGAYDFHQGKTDKPLWIPFTDRLANFMKTVSKEGLTVICNRCGLPPTYAAIRDEMQAVKDLMKHPEPKRYKTHGLRKNATIELYLAGCDDEMVKAVTGHSGVEMLKKYGGQVRQKVLAIKAQEARNLAERNKPRT